MKLRKNTVERERKDRLIEITKQYLIGILGVRGSGKSVLLEAILEKYFDAGYTVLDLWSAPNMENAFWIFAKEGHKKRIPITILTPESFIINEAKIDRFSGNYKEHALTKEESLFILNDLIPSLDLEKQFIDTALTTIKKTSKKGKITDELDEAFLKTAKKFVAKNAKKPKNYVLEELLSLHHEKTRRKITGWRVATMGRLAELRVVDWEINEKGESEFSLN